MDLFTFTIPSFMLTKPRLPERASNIMNFRLVGVRTKNTHPTQVPVGIFIKEDFLPVVENQNFSSDLRHDRALNQSVQPNTAMNDADSEKALLSSDSDSVDSCKDYVSIFYSL